MDVVDADAAVVVLSHRLSILPPLPQGRLPPVHFTLQEALIVGNCHEQVVGVVTCHGVVSLRPCLVYVCCAGFICHHHLSDCCEAAVFIQFIMETVHTTRLILFTSAVLGSSVTITSVVVVRQQQSSSSSLWRQCTLLDLSCFVPAVFIFYSFLVVLVSSPHQSPRCGV